MLSLPLISKPGTNLSAIPSANPNVTLGVKFGVILGENPNTKVNKTSQHITKELVFQIQHCVIYHNWGKKTLKFGAKLGANGFFVQACKLF